MLELLTAATPNGQKISIALEELSLPYKLTPISLQANEQKAPSFLAINPNGRIPALLDHSRNPPFAVFESGAIMLYLATHYDPSYTFCFPADHWRHNSEMTQWLFWQNAGLGPMQGQANHFFRYAAAKHPYSIERYQAETERLYKVLEGRLAEVEEGWLVGGKYTFADMACFAWVRWAAWAGVGGAGKEGVSGERFPRLKGWVESIEEREAVKKGLTVPGGEDTIARLRRGDEGDEWGEWVREQK